jgi:broad specificity phosphatase PhoE
VAGELEPSYATLTRRAFWYLRHGETDWNAQGLSQGSVDIPLNETGLAQAQEAAAKLRHRGIATIVASPLSRARVTAEIVAGALGRPIAFDDSLREVRFGVQEGQPMSHWFAEWVGERFTPDGAESFAALRRRAVGAMNAWLDAPPPVLFVGHGAFFRALRAEMGQEPNQRLPNAMPMFCEPSEPAWTLTAT